jgi:hypothetical protein
MNDDVIDFIGTKTKATNTIQLENGERFDLDAFLVKRGLDRATVDARLPNTCLTRRMRPRSCTSASCSSYTGRRRFRIYVRK